MLVILSLLFWNVVDLLVLLFHVTKDHTMGVTKSFWTGRLERELQMVQLSATRCSCIANL
jgi:hypothetical protein